MMVTKENCNELREMLKDSEDIGLKNRVFQLINVIENQLVHIETQDLQIKLLKREVTNFHKAMERANTKIKYLQQELNK
jgi:hypothetical protein